MIFPLAFSLPLKNAWKEEGKEYQTLPYYILFVFLKDHFKKKKVIVEAEYNWVNSWQQRQFLSSNDSLMIIVLDS